MCFLKGGRQGTPSVLPPCCACGGLQGREKDIALFSTVRSQRGSRGIGFVADERRINVGLTRARCAVRCVLCAGCTRSWGGAHLNIRPRGSSWCKRPAASWRLSAALPLPALTPLLPVLGCLPGCRATLIVVGHVESLESNPRWKALVSHARKGGCLYKAGAWRLGAMGNAFLWQRD